MWLLNLQKKHLLQKAKNYFSGVYPNNEAYKCQMQKNNIVLWHWTMKNRMEIKAIILTSMQRNTTVSNARHLNMSQVPTKS